MEGAAALGDKASLQKPVTVVVAAIVLYSTSKVESRLRITNHDYVLGTTIVVSVIRHQSSVIS